MNENEFEVKGVTYKPKTVDDDHGCFGCSFRCNGRCMLPGVDCTGLIFVEVKDERAKR